MQAWGDAVSVETNLLGPFGSQPLPLLRTEYAQRIAEWEAWDDLSRAAWTMDG